MPSPKSGLYPCIYCLISSGEMECPRKNRNPSRPRRIGTLLVEHERFEKEGGGDVKKAKNFFNSIRKPIFNVSTEQVV